MCESECDTHFEIDLVCHTQSGKGTVIIIVRLKITTLLGFYSFEAKQDGFR